MAAEKQQPNLSNANGSRMKEIRQILVRNQIQKGLTPQRLRQILEDLGPTFIKLGQIASLHSDILKKEYCEELLKLHSEVTPMPFEMVEEVLEESLGTEWSSYFKTIDHTPLGSASIAQVHRAVLKNDKVVVIKVQRKGIYATMSRDIALLHRLVRVIPFMSGLKKTVDFDMVLDEMWKVAQEEMNFLKEAGNMEEFRSNQKGINYVSVPKLYPEYCTDKVLVMEYVDGIPIDHKEELLAQGYDLDEIGVKFVNSFIKQVMEDGFFHADPHPGNVKIQNGKIVWMDMGMMGRLSNHDRKVMVKGVRGISLHDVSMVEEAVLEIGDFRGKPDHAQLYQDLKLFLDRYGGQGMGQIDIARTMEDLMEIMKENEIALPHGMTMLCRGLAQMEGVLSEISPDLNMFDIASNRMMENMFQDIDWKEEIRKQGVSWWKMVRQGSEIPSLLNGILKEYQAGQSKLSITLRSSDNFTEMVRSAVRNFMIGICVAALLISSSILCMTQMKPLIFGIPALGFLGYSFALLISTLLVVRYVVQKIRKPKKRKI